MADDKKTTAGGSTPTPDPVTDIAPAGAPSDPVPSAGIEPDAQALADTASPVTPAKPDAPRAGGDKSIGGTPTSASGVKSSVGGDGAETPAPNLLPPAESYELPDEYAETWLDKTKAWVEEHPALAVAAAAGIGLVIGRLAMALAPEPEPSVARRVEQKARSLQKDLRKETKGLLKEAKSALKDVKFSDTAEAVQDRLSKAAAALADAAETVSDRAGSAASHAASRAGHAAEAGADKTRDLAETVSDSVQSAVAALVAKVTDDWVKKIKR